MRVGLALVFAAALAGSGPAPAKQVNWPQSYLNSGHTGYNKDESTLSAGNVGGLQVLWGQSADNCQTFADALDKGTLYEMGLESDCNTWNLQALDAATGAVKWDVPTGGPGTSSGQTLATGKGLVFSACGFKDGAGYMYGAMCAFRESDGQLAWQDSAPCDCAPESAIAAQPVYANGSVYYGYGNGGGTCGGDTQYVVAADAKTGAVQWTYVTGGCNTLPNAAITVANGVVYFGCSPNSTREICAVSQSDGSSLWQSPNLGDTVTALVASKTAIYVDVCGTNALDVLDPATGAERWSNSSLNCNGQSMVSLAGKNLYYVGTGKLVDLNARNGNLIWSIGAGQDATGPASVANGVVYVPGGPNDGRSTGTAAYDAATGDLLWNSNASGDSYGVPPPPIVANGVVYGANDSACGSVCAYALPGGTVHR